MAKRKRTSEKLQAGESRPFKSISVDQSALDPALTALFAASTGPVKSHPKSRRSATSNGHDESTELNQDTIDSKTSGHKQIAQNEDSDGVIQGDDEIVEEGSSSVEDAEVTNEEVAGNISSEEADEAQLSSYKETRRKRKTDLDGDDLEQNYLRRMTESHDRTRRSTQDDSSSSSNAAENELEDRYSDVEESAAEDQQPTHESLVSPAASELDKSARTAFLGNVSNSAITSKSARKTLHTHLSSFLSTLPTSDSEPAHKLDSLRFRSTAFASTLPRKVAFAQKDLMPSTSHSTHAYAVYSTARAAREAASRLNGTVVLDRHLRVDCVAHPARVDHRRCVFVGNLDYVDDDSAIRAANAEEHAGPGKKPKVKARPAADVEEGLWRQFGKAGTVESVRVVRDAKTRVGKGFAYVQFTDENAVEAALLYNDKRFPPLLPRKLRVTRAKSIKRNAKPSHPTMRAGRNPAAFAPKLSTEERSTHGRAGKLLGRAAAAQMRKDHRLGLDKAKGIKGPESFVFEGHRASSKQGTSGLKLGKPGKGKKGMDRSKKRAAAWKAGLKNK